ncbi:MAG: ferredoxin reductase family protein [Actinobacteria bacterium]|nr:ferredoxin reductase family protein [Actinomycetota bacterium]
MPHRPTFVGSGLVSPWYRRVGPVTVMLLVVAYAALWLVARPAGVPTGTFWGQLLGAQSVLLLSMGLVLVSTLPWVERWFDGIDRAAIWHRRLAIIGMVLLVVHMMTATNPAGTALGKTLAQVGAIGLIALVVWSVLPRWRSLLPPKLHWLPDRAARLRAVALLRKLVGGYERWRGFHRLTGVFVAAGFVHGLLDATTFGSPVLRWSYVAIAGTGLAFYIYRELLARRFMALHDYQVDRVTRVGEGLVEISLRPLGRPLEYAPGQFAMVYLEARDGWHRHPFTMTSAPGEDAIRFTIKALGDWTGAIGDLVEPGMPAVVGGPHGRFTHGKGTGHQVWVAGGVGVTPFLSWLRSLDQHPVHAEVDLFYTSAEDPVPYTKEIQAIAARHNEVSVHIVRSAVDGRLSATRILEEVSARPRDLSVFLCGPEPLVAAISDGLRDGGVPAGRFHREYFDWR